MATSLTPTGRAQRARLSDSVYETLLEEIVSGRLAPGSIVSEVSLAKQLEVSRTPVHDAMRQLAKDGLVEQRAGRRAIITTFTKDDLQEIFEMRIVLEAEAARRAAARIDTDTVAELRATGETLKLVTDASDYLSRWADFDEDFHEAIAKAAGSVRLWQDISRYRLLHRGFNKLATNAQDLQEALAEHFQILEALGNRDGATAARCMVAHIEKWQAYFVEHLPRND